MGFTEEELTKMAILKAQSLEKAPDIDINPKPNNDVVEPIPPAPTQPTEKTPEIKTEQNIKKPLEEKVKDKFKYKVILGKNKEVHYTNWTGKTKKIFNKLLEQKGEEISLDDISSKLIRDYIQEQDIYLSALEEQYLIVKIRDISLSDEYTFVSNCPHCDEMETITDKTSNIFKYRKSKFPKKIGDVEYVDIESNSVFKKTVDSILNSPDYDGISTIGDIEIAMHLKIEGKETPLEIMDYIDTLPLKDIQVILDNLSEVSSDLKMGVERVCKKCGERGFFECEEIPNVFEELL